MMYQRTATAAYRDDLDAAALEQTNRRRVDFRRDDGLNTTRHERDALAAHRRLHSRNCLLR